MTAIPLPNAKVKFWDRNGNPLSGGKLYTWEAGSVVTNKTTWKDANKVTANTNPVILDAFGEADIWLDGNYQINLTNSSDVNQWSAPIDNISSIGGLTEFLYTTTGFPDAYIITPTPAITSYDGLVFSFKANFTNTAPATLNISGVGVTPLRKVGGVALAAGDIVSGRIYQCAYDGTNFQILNISQNITLTGDVTGSGTGSFAATISNGAVTAAKIGSIEGEINDDNGNVQIKFDGLASAVNYVSIANAATTGAPSITAVGGDTNIDLNLQPKGSGQVILDNLTFPAADGSADDYLKTDGSGNLAFAGKKGLTQYSGASVYSGAMPTSYTDLDLSGTIGANRCLVTLSVEPDTNTELAFRTNGETKNVAGTTAGGGTNFGAGTSGCTTNSGAIGYVQVTTDAGGVVEWISDVAGTTTTVTLLTYTIL
jgi:hypothetical protein